MTPLLAGVTIAVLGLSAVEWLARRGGARRWQPRRRAHGLGALALLLIAAQAAPRLELRYGDGLVPRLLVAALALLLGVYLWQLLPRLRPLLGRQLVARPSVVFFALPFIVYMAVMPWSTAERPPDGDEPYYLLVTHSLVHDRDVDLADNYRAEDSRSFVGRALEPQKGDPVGPAGELYSRHNALLPAVLVPAYAVAGRHGALAVMCALAALLCWWTLRLAARWYPDRPGEVLIAWFVLAFTSPLLLYSHQVWVEVPAALLLTISLDACWRLSPEGGSPLRRWLQLLVPLAILPLMKMRFLLIIPPLLAIVAYRLGRRGRRVALAALAGVVVLAAAILWFNQLTYGNPLKYHDITKLSFYWNELDRYPRGFVGLFYDSAFGLFATAPIWLLLAVARPPRALVAQAFVLTAPYLAALIPRSEWYGAWSPPFRYGVFALSLMTLLLVPAFDRRRGAGRRLVTGALVSATGLLTMLWVMRPGWTYNFAHGRNHLIDLLSTSFGVDLARFLPSGLRPNLALWLWPPLSLLVIWLATRWRRRIRSAAWLGAAVPLLGLALLPVAGHRVPTRIVEAEDPHIVTGGGGIFPEMWVTGRTRYRGGYRLEGGQRLEIPVVPGGDLCRVTAEIRRDGRKPARTFLKVGARGQRRMVRAPLEKSIRWTEVELPEIAWPEGGRWMVVEVRMPRGAPPDAAVVIDRLRLSWSDRAPPSSGKGAPAAGE